MVAAAALPVDASEPRFDRRDAGTPQLPRERAGPEQSQLVADSHPIARLEHRALRTLALVLQVAPQPCHAGAPRELLLVACEEPVQSREHHLGVAGAGEPRGGCAQCRLLACAGLLAQL